MTALMTTIRMAPKRINLRTSSAILSNKYSRNTVPERLKLVSKWYGSSALELRSHLKSSTSRRMRMNRVALPPLPRQRTYRPSCTSKRTIRILAMWVAHSTRQIWLSVSQIPEVVALDSKPPFSSHTSRWRYRRWTKIIRSIIDTLRERPMRT